MRKWHKWTGLILSLFFLVFAVSGIFLNHRKALAEVDVTRNFLLPNYRYSNWNNNSLMGSVKLSPDSVLYYGGIGMLLSDSSGQAIDYFTRGMKPGYENQLVTGMAKTVSGDLFAVSTYELYRLNSQKNGWSVETNHVEFDERISDIMAVGDSVVLLTRSNVFVSTPPYQTFEKIELQSPPGYQPKASLFRTMWTLHSGELFGLPGILLGDLLGVVCILLVVTGIIYTVSPTIMRWRKKRKQNGKDVANLMKNSMKLHNFLGAKMLILIFGVILTGLFLRPPLLIGIVRFSVPTIPYTLLHNQNPWFDKLRSIRYDEHAGDWVFYASDGFYTIDNLHAQPQKVDVPPPVSVMGITVLEQERNGEWLVGSFAGVYFWNRSEGTIIDSKTNQPAIIKHGGMPTFTNAVSGFSSDYKNNRVVFDYITGARGINSDVEFIPMPKFIRENGRISLWHLCLEAHTGRIYFPLTTLWSDVFIFLSGGMLLFVTVSGYVVYRRRYKNKKKPDNA